MDPKASACARIQLSQTAFDNTACLPAFQPPGEFLNVVSHRRSPAAHCTCEQTNVDKSSESHSAAQCVKGAFDCSALVFYKSPGAGRGVGGVVLDV